MKIWHLLSNRWNSAITEYALSTAHALNLVGQSSLFTPLRGAPADQRSRALGLMTRSVESFSIQQVKNLRDIKNEFSPDAVITYGGPEAFITRFLGLSPRSTHVRFRGHALPKDRGLTNLKQRMGLRFVDVVLTPSQAIAEEMVSRQLHSRVTSVILGCDSLRFHRASSKVAQVTLLRPQVLIFGRFDPIKGHRNFLEIFSHLKCLDWQTCPLPLLHIVGESANLSKKDIVLAAQENGLIEGEDFLVTEERIADVAALMGQATLGVISSLGSEVICRVAEEFLLCGTPVLVSGVGSLDEVLLHPSFGASYRGLKTPETAALAQGLICKSWQESEEQKIMRSRLAKEYFSLEVMGKRIRDLLE